MRILRVSLRHKTKEELKTCIECIARFENLKQLKLNLDDSESTDYYLSLIGQKFNKRLNWMLFIGFRFPNYSSGIFQIQSY